MWKRSSLLFIFIIAAASAEEWTELREISIRDFAAAMSIGLGVPITVAPEVPEITLRGVVPDGEGWQDWISKSGGVTVTVSETGYHISLPAESPKPAMAISGRGAGGLLQAIQPSIARDGDLYVLRETPSVLEELLEIAETARQEAMQYAYVRLEVWSVSDDVVKGWHVTPSTSWGLRVAPGAGAWTVAYDALGLGAGIQRDDDQSERTMRWAGMLPSGRWLETWRGETIDREVEEYIDGQRYRSGIQQERVGLAVRARVLPLRDGAWLMEYSIDDTEKIASGTRGARWAGHAVLPRGQVVMLGEVKREVATTRRRIFGRTKSTVHSTLVILASIEDHTDGADPISHH